MKKLKQQVLQLQMKKMLRKSDNMQYFYDTNVLLSKEEKWFNQPEPFWISSVTIEELEQIKNSENKNPEIKYLARKAGRWLIDNPDKYKVFLFDINDCRFKKFPFTIDSADKMILASVIATSSKVTFLGEPTTYCAI